MQHLDVSTPQRHELQHPDLSVLLLGVSTPHRGRRCIWTYLDNSSMSYIWTYLLPKPVLHLDVSRLQELVLYIGTFLD